MPFSSIQIAEQHSEKKLQMTWKIKDDIEDSLFYSIGYSLLSTIFGFDSVTYSDWPDSDCSSYVSQLKKGSGSASLRLHPSQLEGGSGSGSGSASLRLHPSQLKGDSGSGSASLRLRPNQNPPPFAPSHTPPLFRHLYQQISGSSFHEGCVVVKGFFRRLEWKEIGTIE